jgi:predicted Rossmann fold flavoprotein
VPSLFTLHIDDARLQGISGLAVEAACASVPGTQLSERGPVLVTHWGLSGPAILRLSAWGARELAALNYVFPVRINWLGDVNSVRAAELLQTVRQNNGAKLIRNVALPPVPMRLWEKIVAATQISSEARWSGLTKQQSQALAHELTEAEFKVTGKSMNKEEFVTCGGVKLPEVNFKTMESRVCPGLHFAGELLDIDGITGGFNFQAAWTTGWLAGNAMADGLTVGMA